MPVPLESHHARNQPRRGTEGFLNWAAKQSLNPSDKNRFTGMIWVER